MSGEGGGRDERPDAGMLASARVVALWTSTGLIAFTVLADSLGRLFIRPDFHVSEILFGTLVGAWLTLLGLESAAIVARLRNGNGNGHK